MRGGSAWSRRVSISFGLYVYVDVWVTSAMLVNERPNQQQVGFRKIWVPFALLPRIGLKFSGRTRDCYT
jgi:hypothetical protein